LLPIVITILVETGLRIYNYGGSTALFVSIPDENSPYYGINLDVVKRYFRKLSDAPTPRKDLFLKQKPDNGYRIFVLGESSAAGFPYGNNVTFSRILNRRLSDMFPEKRIEIVNTALTAINTYAHLDFMDEILQYKPDAILIYAGHNEFYGALGVGSRESIGKNRWIVKVTLALQKFKIYMLIRDILTGIGNMIAGNASVNNVNDPSATLMERIVKDEIIPFKSEDYELGLNQFRENIREIIEKAQHAGVKVVISELVSNIHDNEPFESVEGNGNPSAREVFSRAVNYEIQGKFEEAKNDFYLAKDLDALRFRAPEDFNRIIHEVASESHIPVVPMKDYFESHSPHNIIGNNLMLEHLHPNIDGYFLMADAFFNTMRREGLISDDWQERNSPPSSYYRANWGFTTLDSAYASLIVLRLKGGWPFKKKRGPNLVLNNMKLSTKIDSIVIDILATGTMTLEQGHIELAKYYKSKRELEKAFKEYKALIYTVPYFELFYEPAVIILVSMNKYDKALEVLFELLKYQETVFAYQWIGQIYLITGKTSKGVAFLEKAREKDPHNPVLLYNLGFGYFTISQFDKGNEILSQLKKNSANLTLASKLEEFKNYRLSMN
jgi:tetratricopeptide (TPR) repeat protein